jgi:uncharacterized MAPEG superfamily protein
MGPQTSLGPIHPVNGGHGKPGVGAFSNFAVGSSGSPTLINNGGLFRYNRIGDGVSVSAPTVALQHNSRRWEYLVRERGGFEMTIAYWCVVLTAFLPVIWAGFAKFGAQHYDNERPRDSLDRLSGWAQRANWAQLNSYETFPPFAAGVIIAHLTATEQSTIDTIAVVFLACRIGHGVAYLANLPTMRSLVWSAGFLATVGLYIAAGWS